MEPRALAEARKAEWESVPRPVFCVSSSGRVHVVIGTNSRYTFCGKRVRGGWVIHPMTQWSTEWGPCEDCGQWIAEIDSLSR